MFEQSEWIWQNNNNLKNEYCDFQVKFKAKKELQTKINISCDSYIMLYLNGKYIYGCNYSDYKEYKVYESIILDEELLQEDNIISIICWYIGKDCFSYKNNDAGIIFEIVNGQEILATSNSNIKSRISRGYLSHRNEMMTAQLAYNFAYNALDYDNWIENGNFAFGKDSVIKNKPTKFNARPIKQLELGDREKVKLSFQGVFEQEEGNSIAQIMQNSGLFFISSLELKNEHTDFSTGSMTFKSDKKDGIFMVFDLLSETVGFLDFDIEVKKDCTLMIGFGEHLKDGRVRSFVGGRNFSIEYLAKKGQNKFFSTFRRLGLRYIQLFANIDEIKINYFGIRSVNYPVKIYPFEIRDRLFKEIYEISIKTLRVCMHDHYEDTPWREQCLYSMDSRNQMLFGYIAFKEYDFAKNSLRILSHNCDFDGQLNLGCNRNENYFIPSFSLIYIVQLEEYFNASKDIEFIKEIKNIADKIIETFTQKIDDNGLIPAFEEPRYWNFYEWRENLDNWGKSFNNKRYDLPLNAFYIMALNSYEKICNLCNEDFKKYENIRNNLINKCNACFFDSEKNIYKTYLNEKENVYSELANSLAILSKIVKPDKQRTIIENMLKFKDIIKTSISHCLFKYQALIMVDFEKYQGLILDEITQRYLYMIKNQATTFWETDLGCDDFKGGGSLSHGWSALPIYIFNEFKRRNILI